MSMHCIYIMYKPIYINLQCRFYIHLHIVFFVFFQAACQDTSQPGSCYFWYDINNPNVKYHVISTTELPENELCIKCCEVEGTPIIPCNCVQDQQTFSTARKIILCQLIQNQLLIWFFRFSTPLFLLPRVTLPKLWLHINCSEQQV